MNSLDKKTAIQSVQTRQMMATSNMSLRTSTGLAAILAYMQWDVVDHEVVFAWFSLIVLVALSRAALVMAYQRAPVDNGAATHVRLVRFRLGVLVAGGVWGLAGFLLFPAHHPQYQMFLIFMLAGLTAGGVVSYSADLLSGIVFSVSALVPLVVRLFVAGDSLSIAMAMAVMLYLGFMIMSLRHINRNLCENIILRLEAAAREATVRASEERYRLLLSHLPVGIFHYDTNLVITFCNDRFADILHNSIEHIIGLDMKFLKDQAVLPALRKAIEGERSYYEGNYCATFSDANIWIAMTCAPSLDGRGKIVGGIAIVQDITEHKLAEEVLRASEYRYRLLVESSPLCIHEIDLEGRLQSMNRVGLNMLGLDDARKICGMPYLDAVSPQDAGRVGALLRDAITNGTPSHFEFTATGDVPLYFKSCFIPIKDTNGNVLKLMGITEDITGRKQAEEKIYQQAFYDLLTGLPNRRLLNDRLDQTLAASKRGGRYGALMFMDLDNFKPLNDTHGHGVGDLLLMEVARRISSCVREVDTVARFGGDEFVVILSELDADKAESLAQTGIIAEKIRAALAEPYMLTIPQEGETETITVEHRCTSSIGVVLFISYETSAENILKWADMAMYQAKDGGRNLIRFFDSPHYL